MTRDQALKIAGVAATVLLVPGGSLIAATIIARHWRARRQEAPERSPGD
jgi:hypothetical protein